MPRRPALPPSTTPGARVKAARKAAGLTQRQLAARLGCAQPQIAKVERDQAAPSLDRLYALAQAIGCDPGTLDPRLKRPD